MKQNYGLEGYGVGGIYLGLLRGQFTPGFVRELKQRLFGVGKSARLPPGFIDPRFAEKIGIQKRWESQLRSSNPHKHPSLRHAHVARMTSPYLTAGIERYDRLAATCGVEARHPLLDRELMEFCISLPWQQKVNGGWSKWCMRRVAQHFLPHAVAWRSRRDQIMWKFWDAWDTLNRAEFHKQLDRLANQQSATRYLDYKGLKKACHSSIIGGSGEREVALEALIQHGWLEAWKG